MKTILMSPLHSKSYKSFIGLLSSISTIEVGQIFVLQGKKSLNRITSGFKFVRGCCVKLTQTSI